MAAGCCAAFYMQVSLRVPTEAREAMAMDELAKKVAITFDDGPNPDYTEELLSGLKERGVSATFFLLGKEVEQYPEIVKKIHEGGHLIGTHAYEPKDWATSNSSVIAQRVLGDVEENDIILLHDASESSVLAAFKIIDELKAQGYTFVTVEDILLE